MVGIKTQEGSSLSFATADDAPGGASASIVPMFQGLALCLAIFFIGLHIYKRWVKPQNGVGQRRIRLLERVALSGKSSLVLAEVDGRSVLLTVGSDRVNVHSLEDSNLLSSSIGNLCAEEQISVS